MNLTIHDIYRFTVTFPAQGETQVFPSNSFLEWSYEPVNDHAVYFRKDLRTTLKFVDKPSEGISDFKYLYDHDRSRNKCEVLPILIEKKCGEVWHEWFEGEIHTVDCTFNADKCVADVRVRTLDQWTCVEKSLKKKFDVFRDQFSRETVTPLYGQYEYADCLRPPLGPDDGEDLRVPLDGCVHCFTCVDRTEGWTLMEHDARESPGNTLDEKRTVWIREFVIQPTQPSSEWQNVGGNKWVRNVPMREVERIIIPNQRHYVRYEPALIDEFDNGVFLNSIVEALLEDCDLTIVSDFYGINPDSTAPDNHPYQKALLECREIVVFQKSDIRFSDASNNATRFPLTLEQLLKHMEVVHNVFAGFDINGNFRLEHITYWTGEFNLNLLQEGIKHQIAGKNGYSYTKDDLPRREIFTWMDKFRSTDFNGTPIEYESCFTDEANDEKTYNADYLTTDIETMRQRPDLFSDDGMVWIATAGGTILRDIGLITGFYHYNMALGFANLHYNYHRWHRPQKEGIMNDNVEQFPLVMPTRQQETLEIIMCCDDVIAFRAEDRILTQLGWGYVESATLRDPLGKLTLETKHV